MTRVLKKENQPKTEWEKTFDETFYPTGINWKIVDIEYHAESIKSFIRSLLIQEYKNGHNQALRDQKLTGEENQHLYL